MGDEAPPSSTQKLSDPQEAYDLRKVLGRGSFGAVYYAVRKADGMECAVKRLEVSLAHAVASPAPARLRCWRFLIFSCLCFFFFFFFFSLSSSSLRCSAASSGSCAGSPAAAVANRWHKRNR